MPAARHTPPKPAPRRRTPAKPAPTTNIGINIAGADKAALDAVTDSIERIFAAAYNAHIDQATIAEAIRTLRKVGTVNDTTIQNCNVTMGQPDQRRFGSA